MANVFSNSVTMRSARLQPIGWSASREGVTFGAPLHVIFRLRDEQGTKEEKVFMGELPLITPQGSFVINGAERVIVSQLHRSPGLAFEATPFNGKTMHSFRIIPDRGSWYEAQFDTNDLLFVYLDRKKRRRKFRPLPFSGPWAMGPMPTFFGSSMISRKSR